MVTALPSARGSLESRVLPDVSDHTLTTRITTAHCRGRPPERLCLNHDRARRLTDRVGRRDGTPGLAHDRPALRARPGHDRRGRAWRQDSRAHTIRGVNRWTLPTVLMLAPALVAWTACGGSSSGEIDDGALAVELSEALDIAAPVRCFGEAGAVKGAAYDRRCVVSVVRHESKGGFFDTDDGFYPQATTTREEVSVFVRTGEGAWCVVAPEVNTRSC